MMMNTALLLAAVALGSTSALNSNPSHTSAIMGMKLRTVPGHIQDLVVHHIRARGLLDEQTLESLESTRSRRQSSSCPVQTANPSTCTAGNIDTLFFTFSDDDGGFGDDGVGDDDGEDFTCASLRGTMDELRGLIDQVPDSEKATFNAVIGCLDKLVNWVCKYGDCFNQADTLFDLDLATSSQENNAATCNNACLVTVFQGVKELVSLLDAFDNDPNCAIFGDDDGDESPPPCTGPTTDSTNSQTEEKLTYSVTESSSKTSTTFGCPEGHTLYVYDAKYGNDATPCRNDTIALAVASKCNEHRFCTIDLNNMCDVCSGVDATLELTYVCVAGFDFESGVDKTLDSLASIFDEYICAKDGDGAYCGALVASYVGDAENGGLSKTECESIASTCCAASFVAYIQDQADVVGISQTEIMLFEKNARSECDVHSVSVDNMFTADAECGGSADTTGGVVQDTFQSAVESGSSATAITATAGMVMAALLAQLF